MARYIPVLSLLDSLSLLLTTIYVVYLLYCTELVPLLPDSILWDLNHQLVAPFTSNRNIAPESLEQVSFDLAPHAEKLSGADLFSSI